MKELIQKQVLKEISGPMTVEQLLANLVNKYEYNAITLNMAIQDLINKGDLKMNNNTIFPVERINETQEMTIVPKTPQAQTSPIMDLPFPVDQKSVSTLKTTRGNNMQKTRNNSKFKVSNKLKCTPEQEAFGILVQERRGDIYDALEEAQINLVHRGAEILFAGAGEKAFRYRIGVSGYSDKEDVELPVMYLDWDDLALYDQGGIADQIKNLLGQKTQTTKPQITPAITAQVVGK